jgi:hypothetical protein
MGSQMQHGGKSLPTARPCARVAYWQGGVKMGVMPLDMAADQVNMPAERGVSFTVSQATDADLARQLEDSLTVVAEQLVAAGSEPTKDGLAPPEWYDHANANRHLHHVESVVRRHERLVRTIRREQIDRAARDKAKRQAEKADAKARLERLVSDGPKEAARLADHAQEVVAASERIRGIVSDLRLMGGSGHLAALMGDLHKATATAADALGKPRPDMPAAPDGLPTSQEVAEVLAVFMGRGGFDRTYTPAIDTNADDAARKLRG